VPNNYTEFLKILLDRHDEYEKELKALNVEIRHSSSDFLFYLWLQDDQEAVFSFFAEEGGSGRSLFLHAGWSIDKYF
jgi:hypothetical protein